jgi:serine/threonine protein kinase
VEATIGSAANTYEVLAKLATGGMAEIFLARSKGLAGVERYCVMKRILREHAGDIRFVQMFLDEARLVARLQHSNIAQVYDLGKLGDSFFFTMEYVHGETIRSVITRAKQLHRPIPLACVFTIAVGIAAALHHAHERLGPNDRPLGIVHRDISPSNVIVGFDGIVKVVDFGIAKVDNSSHETRAGMVKGKISYLSPEQARAQVVDRRTDLFALGIVMWELLTGQWLYDRGDDYDTMTAIITEPPPPPSSVRPELPAELDALVIKALSKAPASRFQTAEEMGEAIEAIGQRIGATPSTASLARYLRDIFGARKEAWRTIATPAIAGDKVTMTAEPVPERITASLRGPVDHRLEAVPALGPNTTAKTHVFKLWHRLRNPVAILVGLLFFAATVAVVIAAMPGAKRLRAKVVPAVTTGAPVTDAARPDAPGDAAEPAPAIAPPAIDAGVPRPMHEVTPRPKPRPTPKPKHAPPAIDCKKDPMACP